MIDFFSLFSLSTNELVLIILLLVPFIIQQLYVWNIYGRVAFSKRKADTSPADKGEGVSVIICVRNEKVALEQHLPLFLAQDYPKFEVIVVNDCSEDESESLLGVMKAQHANLEVRHIAKDDIFKHGKAMAVGVGIKAAKYDWLLFSDIDCVPSGEQWLSEMQDNFTASSAVVLGYASHHKANQLVRSDLFFSALHYLGFALKRKPYMANGKNYAYRRKLFFDSKGFDIRMTKEREEIVFVGKVANRQNTRVELRPASIVKSSLPMPRTQWRQLKWSQRASFTFHGSKKKYPAFWDKLSTLIFLPAAVLLAMQSTMMLIVAASFVIVRFTTLSIVLAKACKRLQERKLVMAALGYSIIAPVIGIALSIRPDKLDNKHRWRY